LTCKRHNTEDKAMRISKALKALVGEDANPVIVFAEGDNEGGIFLADVGKYQLVVVSFAEYPHPILADKTIASLDSAINEMAEFLLSEYAGA
jgi:hypothetical protein